MSENWTPQPGETIRAKWTMDGAARLDEAASRLEAFAGELRRLHEAGWTLAEPVQDDYGFLVSPDGDAGPLGDEDLDEDLDDGDRGARGIAGAPPNPN